MKIFISTQSHWNNIMIFDDVICDKNQENMRNFFCLGRHRNIDCFYLTQTYTKVSKHLIRDNCNFVVLFRQDDMNLKHVYSDMGIACDMKFDEFREFCLNCWKKSMVLLSLIKIVMYLHNGRYRKGFSNYLKL